MLSNASTKRKKTEKEKAGIFPRFSNSESAAVTAIIAILLLGLVFTIISIVKLEYVPEWKDSAEQDHAYDIWDNMAGLKENIDMLSGLMESRNYSKNSFSATVPFNIGGGEVPVFESSKSHGKLEVNTERCRMVIKPYTTNQTIIPYTFDCEGISCYSGNRQYPDQVFRYENGALILADGKSSIMKQFPAFTIEENKGNYTVNIRAVELLGKSNSVSSNTLTPLRLTGWEAMTRYDSSSYNNTSVNAFDMTIATKYPHAWYVYFKEIAQDKGLVNGTDYTVELIPNSENPNSVRFYFKPSGDKTLGRLCINETKISAEIIPIRYQNVMKLNQWYCFDTVSDSSIDLSSLMDYGSGSPVNFSIINTCEPLGNKYKENNIFTHDLKNNSLDSIFGFSDFTEFESQPSSVTILMIYQLPTLSNHPYMTIAGKTLPSFPTLIENNGNSWYLYKQTISGLSISDPSDLKFNLEIGAQNGKINIDYLAVYLS